MATILFDPIPSYGHYNGSLQLARLLKQAGHRIVYIGPIEFREKIETAGFSFFVFRHFSLQSPKERKKESLRVWTDCFISIFNNLRLKKFLEISDELKTIIKKIAPNLILLDADFIHKIAIYGKLGIQIVYFETMVSKYYAPNIPPVRYTFVPKNSILSKIYVEFLWFFEECYIQYEIVKGRIIYFDNSNHYIYKKLFALHRIELEERKHIKRANSSKLIPKNVVELIIPPLCFDFPRPQKKNVIHIGPLVNVNRDTIRLDTRYVKIITRIRERKQEDRTILFIYASLGTMSNVSPKREKKFIRVLLKYCSLNTKSQIVFSVGRNYDISNLPSLPDNLFIFNHVPQLDILKYCDLMITHGGMNTLTECILNEIPVLVYPLARKWDQNGNAARVAYHKIGIKGSFSKLSARSLAKSINKMAGKYDYYKNNISKMNAMLDIEGAAQHAVKTVESFIH